MGRLENIIARNQRGKRPRERMVVMIGLGVFLLIVLGLIVFTDLGLPPSPTPPSHDHHVDDVLIRRAAPANPVRSTR